MSTNGAPVVRLDHGVVPTNDLGMSIVFLTQVLGADFRRLVNANLRGLNREVPEMAFFKLANHHGFGYALQGQPIPKPIRPMEGPVWGLELNERSIEEAAELLREHDVPLEGPVEYPASSPIAGSLWVREPGEFVFELSVRREDQRCSDPGQGYLGLCRLSHVRLEVTDLAQAEDWYRDTLGLVDSDPVPGDDQLTLAIPESRQLFILRQVPEMTQRSHYSRGPHVDVKVAIGDYDRFVSRLTNIERYWGPFGDRIPWHEPDMQTVYFYDPFGNRLQIGENKGHPH